MTYPYRDEYVEEQCDEAAKIAVSELDEAQGNVVKKLATQHWIQIRWGATSNEFECYCYVEGEPPRMALSYGFTVSEALENLREEAEE